MTDVGELVTYLTLNQDQMVKSIAAVSSRLNSLTDKPVNRISNAFDKLNSHVMTARGYLKDFSRVATGILMAQFFYQGIIQPIRNSISALWDFNAELERTTVAMKYFLNESTEGVQYFVNELETLAAKTPYTFQNVIDMSKMLLRYGFKKSQLMPMLDTMADTAAAFGMNSQEIENFARALGQVLGKGKLVGQEKKQLGELIPLYQILTEQLHMTGEEVQNQAIPAGKAIMAIITWLQRYKGAATEMEKTTGGVLSSIHDYALFLGRDILTGFFENIREWLIGVRNKLAEAREAFKISGMRGVIASLIPEGSFDTVWQLYQSLIKLGQSLKKLWESLAPVRKAGMELFLVLFQSFITVLNIFGDIIKNNIGIIEKFLKALMAWFIAREIIVVIQGLTIAVKAFYMSLVSNPIVGALTAITAALLYFIATSKSAQSWLSSLSRGIASYGDTVVKTANLMEFIKSTKTAKASFKPLETGLGAIASGFSDIEDSAGKASKKIKDTFLASFDEVYNIPDLTEAASEGIAGMGDMGDFGGGVELGNLREYGDLVGKVSDNLAKQRTTHEDIFGLMAREGRLLAGKKKEEITYFSALKDRLAWTFGVFMKHPIATLKKEIPILVSALEDRMTETVLSWSEGLSNFVLKVSDGISGIVLKISEVVSNIVLQISSYIEQFIIWAINAWETVKRWAIESWNNIKNNAIGIWNEIKQWAITSWNNIKDNAIAIWNYLKFWALLAWEAIKNRAILIWDNIKTKATGIWDAITLWAKTNWDVIVDKAKNIWSAIETWAKNIWTNLTTWAGSQWDAIYEKAKSIWDGIKSFASKVFVEIVNSFIEAWNKLPFADIGKIAVPTVVTPSKSINLTKLDYSNYGKPKGAAMGTVVNKSQWLNVGEGGEPEAIMPLSESVLAPFANMIANAMGSNRGSVNNQIASDYVLIPVNKRQLQRELYTIQRQEILRRGA